jgi:GT2 family glycosyltransferase
MVSSQVSSVAKISVVIPTTGEGGKYLELLLPILAGEKECEVTVVDNASTDNTLEICKLAGVSVVRLDQNYGFARACNEGAKATNLPYILFLNNDTEPVPGFSDEMLKVMEEDEINGIIGAKMLFKLNGKVQHAGISFYEDGWAYELGRNFTPEHPFVNQRRELNAVTAACMLIRRSLFEALGGFDIAYTNGWEDVDLCLQARELGIRILYCPTAIVYHHHFGTPGRLSTERENRKRFAKIWIETERIFSIIGPGDKYGAVRPF